jgi:hypothetical protein
MRDRESSAKVLSCITILKLNTPNKGRNSPSGRAIRRQHPAQILSSHPAKGRNEAPEQPGTGFFLLDRHMFVAINSDIVMVINNDIICTVPLIPPGERGWLYAFTLFSPRAPTSPLPTHDLFVLTPAFVNSQDVSTPVPHLILAVAVYPSRVQVEARLPPSGRLGIHQCSQRDMPHIAADAEL